MSFFRVLRTTSLLIFLSLGVSIASENPNPVEIQVAVASNFANCFAALVKDFTNETGIIVVASPGSTGRHFAQIKAGAPFQAFLAADALRPRLLEECGIALPGSRFTYAVGRLVFWHPAATDVLNGDQNLAELLTDQEIKHLAVANPRLAPYGKAAQQVLAFQDLASSLQQQLVTGQNISQTWQFVASGNAEAGLVALSQVVDVNPGRWQIIPSSMHSPITQQAVLLNCPGSEKQREGAENLLRYLQSPAARQIMRSFGYENDDEIKQ